MRLRCHEVISILKQEFKLNKQEHEACYCLDEVVKMRREKMNLMGELAEENRKKMLIFIIRLFVLFTLV